MSKKTLLSESQIRQFMKLAKLEPMTPGFVEGLTEKKHADEDLEEGRGMRMRGEDDDLEEGRGMRRDEDEVEEGMRGMRRDEDEVEEGMHGMRRDEDEVDEVRTGLGPDYDLTRPKRGHGRGTGAADGLEEQEEMEEAAHEAVEAGGQIETAEQIAERLVRRGEVGAPAVEAAPHEERAARREYGEQQRAAAGVYREPPRLGHRGGDGVREEPREAERAHRAVLGDIVRRRRERDAEVE